MPLDITPNQTYTRLQYIDQVFDEIVRFEGDRSAVYIDTAGIPTIAIGVNLQDVDTRDSVLVALGLDVQNPGNLSLQERTRETFYRNEISALLNNNYTQAQLVNLRTSLDALMSQRFSDPVYTSAEGVARSRNRNSFTLTTGTGGETRQLFDTSFQIFENRLLNSPNIPTQLVDIPYSDERVVLYSMEFNGLLGLSPSFKRAVSDGNRARAWYEIRYGSNPLESADAGMLGPAVRLLGTYNRRNSESEKFGLFNDPADITVDEALNVVRYLSTRLTFIETYLTQIGNKLINGSTRILPAQSINTNFYQHANQAIDFLSQLSGFSGASA